MNWPTITVPSALMPLPTLDDIDGERASGAEPFACVQMNALPPWFPVTTVPSALVSSAVESLPTVLGVITTNRLRSQFAPVSPGGHAQPPVADAQSYWHDFGAGRLQTPALQVPAAW